MKKASKTAISAAVCAVLAMSAASCALSQTYPLTVDGEKIRAGIYILEQSDALSQAQEKLEEEQPDLDTSAEDFSYLKQTVEGISFTDWVNNKTVENCREYMAVERLFAEKGLAISAEELSSIDSNVYSLWTQENAYAQYVLGVNIVGDYYEGIGIGEQSYKDQRINSTKKTELFNAYYGEGGSEAVPDTEKTDYIKEHYVAVNYFEYTLEEDGGAQAYVDRIKGGETYEKVYASYDVLKRKADIQEEMDDAAANEEEYEGESLDSVTEDEFEADSLVQIIEKDSTSPSEDFVKQVFEMNAGDIKLVTVTTGEGDSAVTKEYVVQKLDILAKPELSESYTDTILHALRDDAFDAKISEKAASFTVTEDSSKNMYKIDKLIRS